MCVGILKLTAEAYYAAHCEAYCLGILCVDIIKKTNFKQTSHKIFQCDIFRFEKLKLTDK